MFCCLVVCVNLHGVGDCLGGVIVACKYCAKFFFLV